MWSIKQQVYTEWLARGSHVFQDSDVLHTVKMYVFIYIKKKPDLVFTCVLNISSKLDVTSIYNIQMYLY